MKLVNRAVTVVVLLLLTVFTCAAGEGGGVRPETTALYQKAKEQVSQLQNSPAARYAPEAVEQARQSLATAQSGLEAGSDKETRDGSERAALQAKLALALADERAAAEKTASLRKELAGLEQRLNLILSGKGEQP